MPAIAIPLAIPAAAIPVIPAVPIPVAHVMMQSAIQKKHSATKARKIARQPQTPYVDKWDDVPRPLREAFAMAVEGRRTPGEYRETSLPRYSRVFGASGKSGVSNAKFSVTQTGGPHWDGDHWNNTIASVLHPQFGAFLWCVAEVDYALRDRDALHVWYEKVKHAPEDACAAWVAAVRDKIPKIPRAPGNARVGV